MKLNMRSKEHWSPDEGTWCVTVIEPLRMEEYTVGGEEVVGEFKQGLSDHVRHVSDHAEIVMQAPTL